MKAWPVILLAAVLGLFTSPLPGNQQPPAQGTKEEKAKAPNLKAQDAKAPKYDKATEAKFKGTVQDVKDYQCPISGTLGAHLTLKLDDGQVYEIHLAATRYVKNYEIVFAKGDQIEVLGSKVKFQDGDTILAREITRGNDSFVFRDENGKPVW